MFVRLSDYSSEPTRASVALRIAVGNRSHTAITRCKSASCDAVSSQSVRHKCSARAARHWSQITQPLGRISVASEWRAGSIPARFRRTEMIRSTGRIRRQRRDFTWHFRCGESSDGRCFDHIGLAQPFSAGGGDDGLFPPCRLTMGEESYLLTGLQPESNWCSVVRVGLSNSSRSAPRFGGVVDGVCLTRYPWPGSGCFFDLNQTDRLTLPSRSCVNDQRPEHLGTPPVAVVFAYYTQWCCKIYAARC